MESDEVRKNKEGGKVERSQQEEEGKVKRSGRIRKEGRLRSHSKRLRREGRAAELDEGDKLERSVMGKGKGLDRKGRDLKDD
jgi:hypothetical protein